MTKWKETEIGNIPEDWQFEELEKHSEIIMGQSPESSFYNSDSKGTVFLQGIRTFGSLHPHYDTWTTKITKLAKKNSVLLSVRAPVGEVNIADKDVCIGRGLMSIEAENNRFIYYLFKAFKNYVVNRETGTVYGSVTRDNIARLKFPFPNENEQEAIAKILSDLDSKIELNNQMNATLESMAQAIFKHWFVDFEFPNEDGKPYKSSGGKMVDSELGEIPEGWTVEAIDKNITFLNGLALQKYTPMGNEPYLPVIKIRELRSGITESSDKANIRIPEAYVVNDGDVLFSWSGSLEVVIWGHGKGALNQHLFKINSSRYPKWFYYHWILRHLPEYKHIAESKATTMGHIQRVHLANTLIPIPDTATLREMDNKFSFILDKVVQLKVESRKLIEIRDSLLPKLMSGKIRVPVEVLENA